MGSKYRLAPRLAELFATLPPGPAIDAFSGSGVVAYTLKAAGREVLANDHLHVHLDAGRGARGQRERAVERRGRRAALLRQPRRARLHRHDLRRALLPGRRPRVPGRRLVARRRVGGCQAGAGAERALPRGGVEAAARRVHGHDAALRRRPPAVAHAARGAVPRGRRALQRGGHPRRGARALRRRLHARPGRRRDRLPRPALRAAARRHLLRQALPLPRGPGDVLARPGDHVGDPHAQAAQAPHALRVQADDAVRSGPRCSTISGRRRRSSCPTAPTPMSTPTELEALLARHRRSVRRIEIPHRYAFGTHAAAERRSATEYVFVAR